MPTIRIDDEVYSWLQGNARPFEDTPNSVLRRFAGLDSVETFSSSPDVKGRTDPSRRILRPGGRKPKMMMGRQLNDKWGVNARHALFHRDGCWYNNLERFPGALFDPNGYIVFRTEEEFRTSGNLRIGQQTNVPNGISSIPGYVRVT